MSYAPRFTISNPITNALTRIERARGFLDAAKLSKGWLSRMQARALVLEAHHTTHIEGTQLTLAQAERLWAGKKVAGARPDDARELLNYREAFELVSRHLASGKAITEVVIREIHRRLVQGVRGNAASPGEYRKVQNYVVNARTGNVTYTPPPARQVPALMAKLVEWLATEKETNGVLVAGVAHFQLVHIHPFRDGNGRTARLLSTLCLYQSGYDFKRLFTISEYYDRNRPAYYRALQSVRERRMNLTPWLEYFTEGLATQMREVQDEGERVVRADLLAAQFGLSARQSRAIGLALEQGRFSMRELGALMPKTSQRTLQRDLKQMVAWGLLVARGSTNRLAYELGKAARPPS